MIRSLLRDESNQFRVVEDPSAISDIVENPERLLWIDVERPSAAEFATIQEEFDLHPLAVEDAMARHQRPKVDQYRNFYLVIFYSVAMDVISGSGEGQPVEARDLRASNFHAPGGDVHPTENWNSPTSGNDSHPDGTKASPWGSGDKARDVSPEARAEAEAHKSVGTLTVAMPDAPQPALQASAGADANVMGNERIVLREVSMFMGKNYLITVHNSPIPELDEAARRWRRNAEMIVAEHKDMMSDGQSEKDLPGTRTLAPQEGTQIKPHPHNGGSPPPGSPEAQAAETQHADGIGILLYSLLDSIVDNYFPVIDNIVERVEDLEEQIFEKYNQQAIESIFTLKKDLLALRKVLAPERDVLNILIRRDLPIFEEHTLVYFQDVYDHVVRITDSIDTYRDLLSSALDSFLSMQSNRLNITVQTLTSVSIMLMSIATVTGWYGMNFQHMPELASDFGYPGVIILVVIIVFIEGLFFKRRGWL